MPRETKATKDEVKRRVDIITEMLIKGYNTRDIRRMAKEKWGLSDSQISTYIKKSWHLFQKTTEQDRHKHFILQAQRLERLLQEAWTETPKRNSIILKIIREINVLWGLYEYKEPNNPKNDRIIIE